MNRFTALLSLLLLLAGPASAGLNPAELISQAKTAMAEADAQGYLWRDTGKVLKKAEEALAKGDEAAASKLAIKALQQANDAKAQYTRYYGGAGPRF